MKLATVIGNVQSTVKHPIYEGRKIMIVQPLDADAAPEGATMLALDTVQAGEGDLVLIAPEGNTARQIIGDMQAPVHCVITGIVDAIDRTGATA